MEERCSLGRNQATDQGAVEKGPSWLAGSLEGRLSSRPAPAPVAPRGAVASPGDLEVAARSTPAQFICGINRRHVSGKKRKEVTVDDGELIGSRRREDGPRMALPRTNSAGSGGESVRLA